MKRFKIKFTCKSCEHRLTIEEVYFSDACCPYCGTLSEDTINEVDHHRDSIEVNQKYYKIVELIKNLIKTTRNFYSKEG